MTNRTFLSPEDAARLQEGIRAANAHAEMIREAAGEAVIALRPRLQELGQAIERSFAPVVEALRKTGGPKA